MQPESRSAFAGRRHFGLIVSAWLVAQIAFFLALGTRHGGDTGRYLAAAEMGLTLNWQRAGLQEAGVIESLDSLRVPQGGPRTSAKRLSGSIRATCAPPR